MKRKNIKKADAKVVNPLSEAATRPLSDGMNTPVPDKIETHVRSASEEALYKQAENPLGNPDKK